MRSGEVDLNCPVKGSGRSVSDLSAYGLVFGVLKCHGFSGSGFRVQCLGLGVLGFRGGGL